MISLDKPVKTTITYLKWNDKIAQHFFNLEMAGRTVCLYVTEELINFLGESEKLNCQDFIQAVKNTIGINGICKKALASLRDSRWYERQDYPPYIGYLALFVLAAGTEGDFSNNAYYPRLRGLLGEEPSSRPYPEFDRMQLLWKDLEKWANIRNSGERGNFNVNVSGRLVHVGIPISQTLLTEEELKALQIIFALSGLEPIYHPSNEYIALLLAKHGRDYLRKRTLCLLEEANANNELRCALIERIVDELRIWDGTARIPSQGETYSEDKTKVFGILRLCCKLDSITKVATFSLRCTTKSEFPEEGLILNLNNDIYFCDEHANGWSSPIRWKCNFSQLNASQLDWHQGLRIVSTDDKWYFNLPASTIRIFVEGKSMGLPGLVEVGQVPKSEPFYLVAHQETHSLLEKWGKLNCTGFENLNFVTGLPRGWQLFKIAAAHSDEIVKNKYPILSFPTSTRLELEGGIRVDKGNWYFKFAPPKLVLQGGDELVKLYCNGNLLTSRTNSNTYELPVNTSVNTKIEIEARNDYDIIRRLSLYLVENSSLGSLNISNKLPQIDSVGNVQINQDNNLSGVTGAWVTKSDCPEFNFNTLLPIQGKQQIVFLGTEPGQVASYPQEPLPIDWQPVWAIAKGSFFDRAKFCGTSLKECEPKVSKARDKNKISLWKKILLDNSKRTFPPIEDARFKNLWERYQKEAKRVKG